MGAGLCVVQVGDQLLCPDGAAWSLRAAGDSRGLDAGPIMAHLLLADWPPEKLKEAKESGSLLEASEVAAVVMFMLTRIGPGSRCRYEMERLSRTMFEPFRSCRRCRG